MRQLNEVCRAFYADLHRCACQWPGLGRMTFFPGQKPPPDGHGVHSLPPPPRMYEPFWQGRHWPARGVVRVERLGSRRHDRPRLTRLCRRKARPIALAPFSLTKPKQVLSQRKNCEQQTQAPVALNIPASTGPVAATIVLEREAASDQVQTRVPENAGKPKNNASVRNNPIGSAVAVHESLTYAATRLARYRDGARGARRYDRLHGKPSPQRSQRGAAISGA